VRSSFKKFFKSSHGSAFRTDIAGIRGIAVMIVTLCHFEIPGFGGGFIGPDIFFVLSGYLITGLLVKEYNKNISKRSGRGKISLGAFYLRRTRRILPASLFVLICTNIYAHFNMNVLQLAQLKSDSLWTVFFGANINFLRQATDYFAQNNAVSPLQHYWSLSVEEQFYFVWPVLFLAAASFHKLTIRGREIAWETRLRAVFIGLGISSFIWMLIEFTNTPTTAYFSTFSRAWELAIGGILSLLSIESLAARLERFWTALRGVALVAMVGSIAIVTPSNFGYTLWIPALATGFLLISGAVAKDDVVYRLLSVKPLTALGAISFSLYLWHWPVFVFGRNLDLMDTLPKRLAGVALSIGLGTLSYWLIERTFLRIPLPSSKSRKSSGPRERLTESRLFTASLTGLIVAGLGLVTYPSSASSESVQAASWVPPTTAALYAPSTSVEGLNPSSLGDLTLSQWASKITASTLQTSLTAKQISEVATQVKVELLGGKSGNCNKAAVSTLTNPQTKRFTLDCQWGVSRATAKHRIVLLGDSFADAFTPTVLGAFDLKTSNIRLLNRPSCRLTHSIEKVVDRIESGLCERHLKYVYAELGKEHPDAVIDVELNSEDLAGYRSAKTAVARKLAKLSKRLVIVGTQPIRAKGLDSSECFSAAGEILAKCNNVPTSEASYRLAQQSAAAAAGADYVDPVKWLCTATTCPPFIDGIPTFFDSGHYSQAFASALAPLFGQDLKKIGIGGTKSAANSTVASGSTYSFTRASFENSWEQKKLAGLKITTLPKALNPAYSSLNKLASTLWLNCEGYLPTTQLGTHTCRTGNPKAKNQMLILGDSHARALWPALVASVDLRNWGVTLLAEGNCTFSTVAPLQVLAYNKYCAEHRAFTFDYVARKKPTLVVVSDSIQPRTNLVKMKNGYEQSFSKVRKYAQHVVLATQVPSGPNLAQCVGKSNTMKACQVTAFRDDSPGLAMQKSAARADGIPAVEMRTILCSEGEQGYRCPPVIGNMAVYLDGSHLTAPIATAIAPFFSIEWQKMGLQAVTQFAR